MTEISRPWDGIILGDSGPYSDDQWSDTWLSMMAPILSGEGVFADQLNELNISGAVSPISINTGRAMNDGTWYESGASESIAIGTPAVNPRIDRVVLRKDWALQTIRLTIIGGAEAASPVPPAIVQIDGTTWDVPIWQIRITTGGVISTERDDRVFIGQYNPSGEVTEGQVYLDEEFFLPAVSFSDGDTYKEFVLTIDAAAGNAIADLNEAGFGSGAILLSHGAGTNDSIGFSSVRYRPDQIAAKLTIIAKARNTHAALDRIMGYSDSVNSLTPTNGIFLRCNGTANWFAVCRSGGVETPVDTGQIPSNTFKTWEIKVYSAHVEFLLNGAIVATIASNIPTDTPMSLAVFIFDDTSAPASQAYHAIDMIRMSGDR